MKAQAVLFDPDRPPRDPLFHFGKTLLVHKLRWTGPDGEPEKFKPADYQLWPVLSFMTEVEGRFTSVADLAERADVGITSAHQFLRRLERSGLAAVVHDEHRRVTEVRWNASTRYREASYEEGARGREKRQRRAHLRAPSDPPPPEGARTCAGKRAQVRSEARAPARALLLEEISKIEERNVTLRALALGEGEQDGRDADAGPDPAVPIPPAPAVRPDPIPPAREPPAAPPPDPEEVARQLATANDPRAPTWVRATARLWLVDQGQLCALPSRDPAWVRPAPAPLPAPQPPPPEPALTPTMPRWPDLVATERDTAKLLRMIARPTFDEGAVEALADGLADRLGDWRSIPYYRKQLRLARELVGGGDSAVIQALIGAFEHARGDGSRPNPRFFVADMGRFHEAHAKRPARASP